MSNTVRQVAQRYVDDEKFCGIEWQIETVGANPHLGRLRLCARGTAAQRFLRRLFIVFTQ